MQLTISQQLLSKVLGEVIGALSARTVNPVLSHFRIEAEADKLTVTGTDGDYYLQRSVSLMGAVPGKCLAPANLLRNLVQRFTANQDLQLKLEDNQLTLSCKRAVYDLTAMDDENYPGLPAFSRSLLCTLPASVLRANLQQVDHASVKESSTGGVHYTNGVLFSFKGGRLDIVATDGHRLALRRNSGLAGIDVPDRDLLPPARVAGELAKLLPEEDDTAVEVYHHGNQVVFVVGSLTVVSALLDVRFPDYERVIPGNIEAKIHCDREELINTMGRVLLVCRQRDQNPIARLKAKGKELEVSSEASEIGKGSEALDVEIHGSDELDIKVAMNPQYIIDCLKNLPGQQVTLNWISEIQPVMVTCSQVPDFSGIIMPIRMD